MERGNEEVVDKGEGRICQPKLLNKMKIKKLLNKIKIMKAQHKSNGYYIFMFCT